MKKIIEFLESNGIEYEEVTCGNPYYYNDGFTVPAITVSFNYDLADNPDKLRKKEKAFLSYMKRKKAHCIGYSGKCGICESWYRVFNTFDFKRLEDHESRIHADVEKFWEEEHERRMKLEETA